jgi:hypothetical protein
MMGRRILDSILMMVIELRSTCGININIFNTLQNKLKIRYIYWTMVSGT